MKLINKTVNNFSHFIVENGKIKTYKLESGNFIDVPESIAEIWLKINGIEKYVDPVEAEKKENALKSENEALKAELKKLKQEKTQANKSGNKSKNNNKNK